MKSAKNLSRKQSTRQKAWLRIVTNLKTEQAGNSDSTSATETQYYKTRKSNNKEMTRQTKTQKLNASLKQESLLAVSQLTDFEHTNAANKQTLTTHSDKTRHYNKTQTQMQRTRWNHSYTTTNLELEKNSSTKSAASKLTIRLR